MGIISMSYEIVEFYQHVQKSRILGRVIKEIAKNNNYGILLASMRTHLRTAQIQKPVLAPAMQQSIEMLLLPLGEMHVAIEQELQNNPLLEAEEALLPPWQDQFEKAIEKSMQFYEDADPSTNNEYGSDYSSGGERPLMKSISL